MNPTIVSMLATTRHDDLLREAEAYRVANEARAVRRRRRVTLRLPRVLSGLDPAKSPARASVGRP